MEIHGVPEFVIVGGRVCVDDCAIKCVQGFGKYIESIPYPPYVYEALDEKSDRIRGKARSEAEAKKRAEEDMVYSKARDAARAKLVLMTQNNFNDHQTNGNHEPLQPASNMTPRAGFCTLPNSAVSTPSVKGPRMEGQRNLQDTTFSISGKQLIFCSQIALFIFETKIGVPDGHFFPLPG